MRIFRLRYEKFGRHYHCRVFSADGPDMTWAKLGTLVMDQEDFNVVQMGSIDIEVLPEEGPRS